MIGCKVFNRIHELAQPGFDPMSAREPPKGRLAAAVLRYATALYSPRPFDFTGGARSVDSLGVFVRHHMTRESVSLEPGVRASAALRQLRAARIRHAPVIEGGALVGIVTDRDLLRALPATVGQADRTDAWDPLVAKVMTRKVITIGPNEHVEDAARVFLEHRIHGLPVVDDSGLLGMLTDTDLFRVFARLLSQPAEHRLTLLVRPECKSAPKTDLVRSAVACGLEVASLATEDLADGGAVSAIALNGSGQAIERYLERLAAAGVTPLDMRRGARKSA
ncbi:Inosine-5'-monophosphate dehydrogenase [Planctomycetes bacterium Pla86]|uniref:Inosine-5'-monophosphate dehydrogenase n=2 Tax=Engelhardtia mirabilis TaxID=2528011 RepID=A0A518BGW9_9BACT|nr:Inosine-5'-monophosphate dehydrogenase [Planctomycetes bacterium Pla133]QDV00533.1 Inosine-5'-monophosphate dehydrogenase [Planctomycetes bacterium Pla86]